MGKKCDRVTAGIIGGGVTGKATRPTGVCASRKGAGGGIPSRPSFRRPRKDGALRAKRACRPGQTLGVRQPSPPVCLTVRCFPLWRTLVLSSPRYLRRYFAVWPSATHQECSASTPRLMLGSAGPSRRSSARSRSVSHGLGSCVKTKPLRRRVSLGLDPPARHAGEWVMSRKERDGKEVM